MAIDLKTFFSDLGNIGFLISILAVIISYFRLKAAKKSNEIYAQKEIIISQVKNVVNILDTLQKGYFTINLTNFNTIGGSSATPIKSTLLTLPCSREC